MRPTPLDLAAVIRQVKGSRATPPEGTLSLARAEAIADAFIAGLDVPAYVAGSVRRGEPEVGDIDIVTIGTPTRLPPGATLVGGRTQLWHYRFRGRIIDVWKATPETLGSMLLFATGPKNYGIGLRMRAKNRGLKLNRYGLWRGEQRLAGTTEAGIYEALGKPYKPPELRGKRQTKKGKPKTGLDLGSIIARVRGSTARRTATVTTKERIETGVIEIVEDYEDETGRPAPFSHILWAMNQALAHRGIRVDPLVLRTVINEHVRTGMIYFDDPGWRLG